MIAASLAVLLLPASANSAKPLAKPVRPATSRNWTQVVAATPAGGFVLGNPKAKVNPGHSSNMALFGQKDD